MKNLEYLKDCSALLLKISRRVFTTTFVKKNASFRAKAGVEPKIIRKDDGKCCEWCSDLTGTYDYDKRPDDIFRRHKNCSCTVVVEYSKNRYRNVWDQKDYQSEKEARIAQAKEMEELDKLSHKEKIDRRAALDAEYSRNYRKNGGKKDTGGKKYLPSNNSIKEKQAAKAYKNISKRNDIERISEASGMPKEDIKAIKRHIFYDKHNLYDEYRIFDVDYDMAVAWERLNQGKPLERDIILLNHELLESKYEKIYNHDIAHSLANQKYNWEEQLYRECGESGEKDGLL